MDEVDIQKRVEQTIIRLIQTKCFTSEYELLHGQEFPRNSSLLQLKSFMGSDSLLRVGGRLQHAEIDYDARYPIVMGKLHLTSYSCITATGPRMLALIRQTYQFVGGRRLARRLKQKCVAFCSFDAKTVDQDTAPLPEESIIATHFT